MDEYEERAYQYRQRAEELRAILPDMKDPASRKTLIKLAEDYDRLADRQEKLSKELKDKQQLQNSN